MVKKTGFRRWIDSQLEAEPQLARDVDVLVTKMKREQKLVGLRERRGLSQRGLARLLGTSRPYVAQLGSGCVKSLGARARARRGVRPGAADSWRRGRGSKGGSATGAKTIYLHISKSSEIGCGRACVSGTRVRVMDISPSATAAPLRGDQAGVPHRSTAWFTSPKGKRVDSTGRPIAESHRT